MESHNNEIFSEPKPLIFDIDGEKFQIEQDDLIIEKRNEGYFVVYLKGIFKKIKYIGEGNTIQDAIENLKEVLKPFLSTRECFEKDDFYCISAIYKKRAELKDKILNKLKKGN